LDRAHQDFEAAGVDLVLIGQATPRQAAHFRRTQGVGLRVLADEQRATYRAAGLKKANLGELLGPKIVAKGISTMRATGRMQGRTIGSPNQLGGAAVIAPGDRVLYFQASANAGDNIEPAELLAAARGAAAAS
jgi:hypothetical protein